MEKIPDVSVVIPVYNAADYLDESLKDILCQTHEDFEIICVNDGSTDNSRDVLDKYAQKDSRIKVLTQQNMGGGAARNAGFEIARGKYILFLDADDRFERHLVKKTYETAEREECEVLIFAADEFHYLTKEKSPSPWLLQSGYEQYDGNPFHYTTTTVWNKLYRRDYLLRNNIRHQNERVTAFSMYFTFFALFCASRISFLDEVLVHYRSENPNSSMRRHDSSPLDTIYVLEEIWKRIQTDNDLLKKKEIYLNFAIKNIFERSGWFASYDSFAQVYDALHSNGFSRMGLTDENDRLIDDRNWLQIKRRITEYSLPEYQFLREKDHKNSGLITKTVYLMPQSLREKLDEEERDIVLYGAGMVGRCYFPQLKSFKYINLKAWLDEKYEAIGFPIESPQIMKELRFDYVVIAVEHKRFLDEIKDKMREMGISEEKILWEAPEKQL